jgi:hypothetical protein
MMEITLSPLGHTWLLDLDGTIVKHNGYKTDGFDTFLAGAEEFLKSIPDGDMLVFITSRAEEYRDMTERFLIENGIRFDRVIFDAPFGERIVVNDRKPSGLATAVAVNVERDDGIKFGFVEGDNTNE